MVHLTGAIFAALVFFLAKGSELEAWSGLILIVLGTSMTVHQFRRPQYRVIKARRRAKRLKGRRVSVLVPIMNPLGGGRLRIEARVLFVTVARRDEIIVRADSPVSTTTNVRSDNLALQTIEPGDQFLRLLEQGQMQVQVLLVSKSYLAFRRGILLARRSLRRNPPLDVGSGTVVLEPVRTERPVR